MARPRPRGVRGYVRAIADSFGKHHLVTYAAAIAFQGLVALVPLTLLGLASLGAAGRTDTWSRSIYPEIARRVRPALAGAIDDAALRILEHPSAGLFAVATLLSLWYLAAAMRAVTEALDRIHDVREGRSWRRRVALSVGLSAAAGGGLVATALAISVLPRLARHGALHVVLGLGRWLVAVALLLVVVGLLVRHAPDEKPQARWATEGSALVVVVWIAASLAFRWYASSVANFRSPTGQLAVVLVITGYLFVSSAIFLVGVQFDELLRRSRRA